MAQREIDAGKRFKHPNIIPLIDSTMDTSDPLLPSGALVAYMLFPVYRRGNLFDLTMHNEETGQQLDEDFIIDVFKGVCSAVAYLHSYGSPRKQLETDSNDADGSSLRE
ncbi:Serine/threonine-protein kinase env7, partial [Coemansia guatemalensis]